MASFAPTADLRSGRGHTVPFRGPPVRTRAHSAFRAYGGHTVPFRAYGGHTVPLSPSADARRLSRLRRSLQKETARNLLATPYGEALQKQANRFTKARKEEIHRSHTTSGKQQRKTQKDPALGIPGVGSLLFIREKPSPLFSISQWLPCSASRDV